MANDFVPESHTQQVEGGFPIRIARVGATDFRYHVEMEDQDLFIASIEYKEPVGWKIKLVDHEGARGPSDNVYVGSELSHYHGLAMQRAVSESINRKTGAIRQAALVGEADELTRAVAVKCNRTRVVAVYADEGHYKGFDYCVKSSG